MDAHNGTGRRIYIPYVVVEYLTLLLRIREIPDSYLGLETGYPD
jgi:hypothetical protein